MKEIYKDSYKHQTEESLLKFFDHAKAQLETDVLEQMELLLRHPNQRNITLTLIDVLKVFSKYATTCCCFKQHPSYAYQKAFGQLDLKAVVLLQLGGNFSKLDAQMTDGTVSEKAALMILQLTVQTYLLKISPKPYLYGISSVAA